MATAAQSSKEEAAGPTPNEEVIDGVRYRTAREGLARIYVPLSEGEKTKQNGGGGSGGSDHAQQVFYNPIQQFNRDLSVLAIQAYGTGVLERRAAAQAKKGKKRKREEAEAVAAEPAQPEEAPSKEAGRPLRILDALSATGLRALRYAHELPFGVSVTANDLLPAATESIRRNVALNGLQDKITVTRSDALAHMYAVVARDLTALADASAGVDDGRSRSRAHRPGRPASEKYDVIDLDPYGTAAPFFDAAVQSVRSDGGLLCVTCTDAAVWASQGYPEKCFALYGGAPMKGSQSHEAGLRLVLQALAASAARYGLAVEPQLSLSIDFYCRVFVTVARSPARVKFLAGRAMVVYSCDQGCGSWAAQPLLRSRAHPNSKGSGAFYKFGFAAAPAVDRACDHCGARTHLAGPMYAGPLHNPAFVRRILDRLPDAPADVYATTDRLRGMLQTALEEIVPPPPPSDGPPHPDDALAALDPVPFFFLPTNLAKILHCVTPNEDAVRGALLHLGYTVTRSHCRPGSLKTDAPWSVLWSVMRAWVRQKAPVKTDNIKPGMPAYQLLRLGQEAPLENLDIVFDEQRGRLHARQGDKLVRYPHNPRENWGPMNRAKGH